MKFLTTKHDGKTAIPLRYGEGPDWTLSKDKSGAIFLTGEAADTLAAYQESGSEPEDVKKVNAVCDSVHGLSYADIEKMARAWQAGRIAILPYPIGTKVQVKGRPAVITEFFGYRNERYYKAMYADEAGGEVHLPFDEVGRSTDIPIISTSEELSQL